eukprot:8638838-Karenia_brevis.AAC.1
MSWVSSFWTCQLCGGWTMDPKKKCYTCGAKKQYAQAAAPAKLAPAMSAGVQSAVHKVTSSPPTYSTPDSV